MADHLPPCRAVASALVDVHSGAHLSALDLLALGLVDCVCPLFSPVDIDAPRVRQHDVLALPTGPALVAHRWTSRDWVYFALEPELTPHLVPRESVVQAYRFADIW